MFDEGNMSGMFIMQWYGALRLVTVDLDMIITWPILLNFNNCNKIFEWCLQELPASAFQAYFSFGHVN